MWHACGILTVQACKDAVFYADVTAHPEHVMPRVAAFLRTSQNRYFSDRMTEKVRASIRVRMQESVDAAAAIHRKWILAEYTRAPFLLGALCDERYRADVAAYLLDHCGEGAMQPASPPKTPVEIELRKHLEVPPPPP